MADKPKDQLFMECIFEVQRRVGVRDDEMASCLAGIVISLCLSRHEDPVQFMTWAFDRAKEMGVRAPGRVQ